MWLSGGGGGGCGRTSALDLGLYVGYKSCPSDEFPVRYLSPDDKARDEGTKYPDDVVFVLYCSRTTKMFLHDLLATAGL